MMNVTAMSWLNLSALNLECIDLHSKKKFIEEDKVIYYHEEKKRAKGVSKTVVKSNIQHKNYKTCLFNKKSQIETMLLFKTKLVWVPLTIKDIFWTKAFTP